MSRKGSSVQWKEEAERNRKDSVETITKEFTVQYQPESTENITGNKLTNTNLFCTLGWFNQRASVVRKRLSRL